MCVVATNDWPTTKGDLGGTKLKREMKWSEVCEVRLYTTLNEKYTILNYKQTKMNLLSLSQLFIIMIVKWDYWKKEYKMGLSKEGL